MEAFGDAYPSLYGKITDEKVIDALLFVHAHCNPLWISRKRERVMMRNTIVRVINENELGEDVEEVLLRYLEDTKAI